MIIGKKEDFNIRYVNQERNGRLSYSAYEERVIINIITGLSMYDDLISMLLGNPEERKKVLDWESFLKKHFFDDKPISITPNLEDKIIKIKIGDDEKPIYDLGDGLQTILIISFAMHKFKNSRTLIAIEEPEMYLHPSYQRKLIEVMLYKDFNQTQYLITTHSNHFLDLASEYMDKILIYHFEECNNNFYISSKTNSLQKEIIQSLGVRPSSIFLANCVILVEGISDINYFKKYIELFLQNEGINYIHYEKHYTFLEYAGSNIEHWSFLNGEINEDCINPNIFIVADNDDQLADDEFALMKNKRNK